MKNRPRLLRKLVRDSVLVIAKRLYCEPQYKVSHEGSTIYIDKFFKEDDTVETQLLINVNVW